MLLNSISLALVAAGLIAIHWPGNLWAYFLVPGIACGLMHLFLLIMKWNRQHAG